MPSVAQIEAMLAKDPGDAFLLYALAQEHAKAGNYTAACEYYDKCLTSDPAYCYAYYHKARAILATGDTPAALVVVEAGVRAAIQHKDMKARGELEALRDEVS